MRKSVVILGVLCLCLVNTAAATVADNGKPIVRAWFTWMQEDGTWHEWVESTEENRDILYNVELKIGQPIKCKIEITPKYDCRVDFYIYSLGIAPYDLIQGKRMWGLVSFVDVSANTTVNYTWTLKPNGNWIGHAPINCYWEVNYEPILNLKEDTGSFAFANPIILAEEWQGKEDTGNGDEGDDGGSGGIPGFEGLFAILGMMVVYVAVRRKNGRRK